MSIFYYFFWVLPIRRPCTYEKLLLQYYVNNRYSDISCMSSSELWDLEKKLGNTNWIFSKDKIHQLTCNFRAEVLQ
jgi:hypothetical protein